MPIEESDGKTIYSRETFPYKDSFGTFVIYDLNEGEGLRVNITYPLEKGESHRICKYFKLMEMDECDDNGK